MTVYEQQARALKEIAAELKGIRRALDIIGKSMKPNSYRADNAIVDELAGREDDKAVEQEGKDVDMCGFFGGECDEKHPGFCSNPCDYRYKESEYDG